MRSLLTHLLILLSLLLLVAEDADGRHLWLNSGIVHGYSVSVWPHQVDVFKGIPFAEKPVGKRRFQAPEPKRPWHGVLNATTYARPCVSNTSQTTSPQKNVSEDCLYLNIFADARCQRKLCPILFYVHGGNFYYDSAVMFNDTEIIRKYASDELIFVIPAYRMGIFGFLDLGDPLSDAPYNAGVYDLILALRWVQREAANIGGDVQRITIVGNSGGASAVQFLLASPAIENGTFSQAIILSGAGELRPHANRKLTEIVTRAVECERSTNGTLLDMREQLECLRRVPPERLSGATRDSEAEWISVQPQTDEFLFPADNLATLLERSMKPMPMVISTTKDEMALKRRNRTSAEMCASFFSAFGYETNETAASCGAFYDQHDPELMTRDVFHSFAVKLAVQNTRKGQPAFVGVFAQVNHSHHANDLIYFLGLHPIEQMTANDRLMNEFYPRMIKNFIKNGRPTEDWTPVDLLGRNYFLMDFEVDEEQNDTLVERPHLVPGEIYDPAAVHLWLNDFAQVEMTSLKRKSRRFQRLLQTDVQAAVKQETLLAVEGGSWQTTSAIRVWSAVWAVLSLLVILATAVLVMTTVRLMYRYQTNRGYSLAAAGEGAKILSSKPNNSRRYL